jgi:hypothetical protein
VISTRIGVREESDIRQARRSQQRIGGRVARQIYRMGRRAVGMGNPHPEDQVPSGHQGVDIVAEADPQPAGCPGRRCCCSKSSGVVIFTLAEPLDARHR